MSVRCNESKCKRGTGRTTYADVRVHVPKMQNVQMSYHVKRSQMNVMNYSNNTQWQFGDMSDQLIVRVIGKQPRNYARQHEIKGRYSSKDLFRQWIQARCRSVHGVSKRERDI